MNLPLVEIRHIGSFGEGVGYDENGKVYFVPFAVPGDRLRVRVEEGTSNYFKAEIEEVVEPSKQRVPPKCEYFFECGGCDWQHWEYSEQLKAKETMLAHILQRAGIHCEFVHPVMAATETYGYRNRIQIRRESGHLGFLKKRTHEIVDIEKCAVAHPEINKTIAELRKSDSPADREKIELAVREDGKVNTWINKPHAWAGFQQINEEMNEVLRAWVRSRIEKIESEKVLELYCGDGNLTYAYAPLVKKVVAVDGSKEVIEAAQKKNYDNLSIKFMQAIVAPKLAEKMRVQPFDTILVDPPRQGVGKVLRSFVGDETKNIIYVSCSPVSFASDAKALLGDFILREIQPIDMFPQTRHLEIVAVFAKKVLI